MTGSEAPSERITLWFLITALCVGGAERTLVDLANGLDGNRYDVTVWTIFDAGPLASELDADVTVRSLTDRGRVENGSVVSVTSRLVYVTVPLRFCYAVATARPDVVQSFLFFDNVLARLAGLVSPATIITGVRAVPNDPSRIRATVDRATLWLSDHVVSNSAAGAEFVVDRGAEPDNVSVVRNGRDVERYRMASAVDVKRELDVADGDLVVGTVGRLIERKGHFELIRAWADVVDRIPQARLLVIGDGTDREAIERHAESVECADSIEFLGNRGDVPELLAAMDVFVFPSHFEGLPGAVIEAMAAGRPIVATPVDGTTELLESYRTGLFVPVRSPEPLGWAITRLLETPRLRHRLGVAAADCAAERYTIDAMVEGFDAVYRELEGLDEAPSTAAIDVASLARST